MQKAGRDVSSSVIGDEDQSLMSKDFELAPEVFFDNRIGKQCNRLARSDNDSFHLDELDKIITQSESGMRLQKSTLRERATIVKQKSQLELSAIRTTVQDTCKSRNPKSYDDRKEIHDLVEDLRQERQEIWSTMRGGKCHMRNADKRKLRGWFRELDHDASGEVNADELQDPMISFGVLKTREQVIRVLNNIDRNRTTGIDFDEFLMALNSKDTSNIQSLQRMQQAHSNAVGFSVDTLITAERRKKLIRSVVQASEKRNRELEFTYMRLNQHRTGPGVKSEDGSGTGSKSLATLEVKHNRHMRLNNKYIASLNLVVQSKIRNMKSDDARREFEKQLNEDECADLTPEKIRAMTIIDDCSLLSKPSKVRRFLEFRKSFNITDEYGGSLAPISEFSEIEESKTTNFDDSILDLDGEPRNKHSIYGPKTDLQVTKVPGMGLYGPRRPKLCSSLPPAPRVISMERSHFSQSLRGPLSRSLLETPVSAPHPGAGNAR